jgi:large subunit ribosomal protein L17
MRHKKSFNHLGRTRAHRKAMLSNMATSLIMHKRIETTTAKAKALKRFIEPLITRSKDDSTHSRRMVFSYLQDKEAVSELFREVGVKVADRPGGYTRIIRLGNRQGDNADMCLIELVDYNEIMLAEKVASKKSTSRRRRGAKKKEGEAVAEAVAEEQPAAEVAEEVAEEQEKPETGEDGTEDKKDS